MPASEAVVLPSSVIPQKYTLKLQPDFEDFTFQGEEIIDVQIAESTSVILLNSSDIEIQSAALLRDGVTTIANGIAHDEGAQPPCPHAPPLPGNINYAAAAPISELATTYGHANGWIIRGHFNAFSHRLVCHDNVSRPTQQSTRGGNRPAIIPSVWMLTTALLSPYST